MNVPYKMSLTFLSIFPRPHGHLKISHGLESTGWVHFDISPLDPSKQLSYSFTCPFLPHTLKLPCYTRQYGNVIKHAHRSSAAPLEASPHAPHLSTSPRNCGPNIDKCIRYITPTPPHWGTPLIVTLSAMLEHTGSELAHKLRQERQRQWEICQQANPHLPSYVTFPSNLPRATQ